MAKLTWTLAFLFAVLVTALAADQCTTPDGSSCAWYTECLEKQRSCSGTKDAYAIEYAQNYCEAFGANLIRFSSGGKKWVDAVRKCLQEALVPALVTDSVLTCKDIRKLGFDSHTPCYLNPGSGAPGFCDLTIKDMRTTLNIIRDSLRPFSGVSVEAWKGIWNVAFTKCAPKLMARGVSSFGDLFGQKKDL